MNYLERYLEVRDIILQIRDDTNRPAQVRAKAAEVAALFDAPKLITIKNIFQNGTIAEQVAALGMVQSAIISAQLDD